MSPCLSEDRVGRESWNQIHLILAIVVYRYLERDTAVKLNAASPYQDPRNFVLVVGFICLSSLPSLFCSFYPVYHTTTLTKSKLANFFKNLFGSPFLGATDTPVLDFWWHLPWVSKPGSIPFLVTPSHERSDLSSHYGVCMYVVMWKHFLQREFFHGHPPSVKGIWDNTRFGFIHVQTGGKKFLKNFF